MKQYFSANALHLEDRCWLSVAPRVPLLVTCGGDGLLFAVDPVTNATRRFELPTGMNCAAMAVAPDGSHCLLANGEEIVQFQLENGQSEVMERVIKGAVTALRYSPSGGFLVVGGTDRKPTLYERRTGQTQVCRPGHSKQVVDLFVSSDQQYLGSIGEDQQVLVYRLSSSEQPQEVARYTITKLPECRQLVGCFHPSRPVIFLPGESCLQRLELINERWQMVRVQAINHGANIIVLTECPKEQTLVTSSDKEVCIWNLRTQEKLFQIEQFNLTRAVSAVGTFFGMRDDGQLYRYWRELKEEEPMEVQEQESDRIQFQENDEEEAEEKEEERKEVEFQHQKKTKADKIITCLPQQQLTSATAMFDSQRFLFVNPHGCVIERVEGEETLIQVEFGLENSRKSVITRNRPMQYFDLLPFYLCYASEKEFGLRFSADCEFQTWERMWSGIRGVAMGAGWLAVANDEQIRIFDLCGHEVRSMGFDRELVALRAHENMLAVVYHEGVPMWGNQQLAMQLYLVDYVAAPVRLITGVQVPVRPGAVLQFLDFSVEGMMVAQDSAGGMRAFSLERGDWSSLGLVELQDSRRAWVIGVGNQELIYWRTSHEDPEPTVAPRFALKYAMFSMSSVGSYPEGAQETYESLLWSRFALDHEKARSRLWGRLKVSRPASSRYHYLVASILSEKQIGEKHAQLDDKYHSLVQLYLKSGEGLRALHMCMTCVRSLQGMKRLVQLFDYYNKRGLAIQLQEYCEQKQRELQYEEMQIFEFMRLRESAERSMRPRAEDPMRRPVQRRVESIPSFSQNMSQDSMEASNRLSGSQVSMASGDGDNPFLKRRGTQESLEAKRKEITEHVEKFGIKKKAEERNISRKEKL